MIKFFRVAVVLTCFTLLVGCSGFNKLVYLQDDNKKNPETEFTDFSYQFTPVDYHLEKGDYVYLDIKEPPSPNFSELKITEQTKQLPGAVQQVRHPYLQGYYIDQEGNVSLPQLGKVKLEGLTLDEAITKVQALAEKFYPEPSVKLTLLNFQISVTGEVQNPGTYPIYTKNINIFQAISMAGGANEYGDKSNIRLLRTKADGSAEIKVVDLTLLSGLTTDNFYLQNNDVVLISPVKGKVYTQRGGQVALTATTTAVAVIALVINIFRN